MKIGWIRKDRGLTQADLAAACGTTQQQIARIENGIVDPRASTLRRIADALGCEIGELFYTRDEFLTVVREVAIAREIDVKKATLLDLNALCARDRHVPTFEPYWENIAIKDDNIIWRKE